VSDQELDLTTFSKAEMEQVQRIADRDGVTVEQAATRLAQQWLQEKVKRRTGRAPAKVYDIKRKP
jgi:cytidylate kinase